MDKKRSIREKYFLKRKRFFFDIKQAYFKPLIKIIKKKYNVRKINISLYYPSNYEVNILKILDIDFFKNFKFSLPIIKKIKKCGFADGGKEIFCKLINLEFPSQKY